MNWFLVSTYDLELDHFQDFVLREGEDPDWSELRELVRNRTLVSFNGNNYDLPLVSFALAGANNRELKAASDAIIQNGIPPWKIAKRFKFTLLEPDHIDLIEVAPGKASLKIYAGRMHSPSIQDMPVDDYDAPVTTEQAAAITDYCHNDLLETSRLFDQLRPQIELRAALGAEYGEDLRSRSDAQIAESVIRHRLQGEYGIAVSKPEVPAGHAFRYQTPDFIRFESAAMVKVLETVEATPFRVLSSGKVKFPVGLKNLKVKIGNGQYRMGIGGLHSSEQSIAYHSDDEYLLVDRDVASYYPSIILNCKLYPKHLGTKFLKVYRDLVERRLAAKAAGDKVTADALKITVNGSFGKLGSSHSFLYSPSLLIQVTLTGQLALLMLIETLERAGIPVVSANTDGVVIHCPRERAEEMERIVGLWELETGFVTEETRYQALFSRDVNSYIALKDGGGYKVKGAYAPPGLNKNPVANITTIAAIEYLGKGTPVADTIHGCRDIRQFVCLRNVTGGARCGDQDLGRAVRWYYSEELLLPPITYRVNGHKVPETDGGRPLMVLPAELPGDIDYQRYVNETNSILKEVGHVGA